MAGALWMLAAGLLFASMGVFVKLASANFSSTELAFYRSLFGLVLVSSMLYPKRIPIATPHWRGHLWRGLSGTVAMMLFYYCLTTLPLATALTLNYTSSLFLTGLTLVVYKDKLHLPLAASLVLGFIGIILLLHPTLEREQLLDGLAGLASGFLAGIALMNVRQLGRLGEPATRVVFYLNLIASIACGLWMLRGEVHAVSWHDLPLLFAVGASATFAQLALTRAYRLGHTQVMSTLSYGTIAFGSLFGLVLWNESLPPSGWMGIALIVGSGVLSLRLSPKH